MTHASANSVLAAIDARHPGMKLAKKHLLLFFVQGHHLAHFGTPLFSEKIVISDRSIVVVDVDGATAALPDSEGALNIIGYVVERYSNLSPADLRTLVTTSDPYRYPDTWGEIEHDDLRTWFRREDETDDPDDERPNRAERAMVDQIWKSRQTS